MDLRVIASEGRNICGYGSRRCGEIFENLPEDLALELLENQPNAFEAVTPEGDEESEVSDDEL